MTNKNFKTRNSIEVDENNQITVGNTVAAGANQSVITATTITIGNATVNSTANSTVWTGSANNANNFAGLGPASYLTTAGLAANVLTLTANNANFLNGVAASGYQTAAGMASNVAVLTANNSTNFAGQAQAYYANVTSPSFSTSITVNGVMANGIANASQYWANTSNKLLTVDGIHSAAAYVTLTETSASIAWDQSLGINYQVTLANSGILANATNLMVGLTGMFLVTGNVGGTANLTYATMYHFDGANAITISAGASNNTLLCWHTINSTAILLSRVAGGY
jgi:hypothetical protein